MACRAHRIILLSLVIFGTVQACQSEMVCKDPLGCIIIDEDQSIQIGAALPMSGRQRELGTAWLGEIERAAQAFHGGLGQTFSPVSYDLNCSPENSQEMASLVSSQDKVLLVIASACDTFDSQFAQSVSDAGQNIVWLAQGQTNLPDLPPGNLLLQTSSDPVGTQDQALGLVSAVSRWVFDLFDPPAQVTSTGGIVLGRQSVRSRLEQVETIESSGWRWDCSPDRTCLLIQSGVN